MTLVGVEELKLRKAAVEWLGRSGEYQFFITLTLKQGLIRSPSRDAMMAARAASRWVPITRDQCRHTAWLMRDRIQKKLIGSARYQRGRCFGFLAFHEGDGAEKHHHIHVVAQSPPDMWDVKFKSIVRNVCLKLEWADQIVDVRAIQDIDGCGERAVLFYSLKNGLEALIPEASCLPSSQSLLAAN